MSTVKYTITDWIYSQHNKYSRGHATGMEFRGLATIVVSADNTLLQFLFSETIGAISDISGSRRVASGQWRVGELEKWEAQRRGRPSFYISTLFGQEKNKRTKKQWGEPGIEPGTSRTPSGNHTSRPHAQLINVSEVQDFIDKGHWHFSKWAPSSFRLSLRLD